MDVLTIVLSGCAELLAQQQHLARGCLFVPVPDPLPTVLADVLVRLQAPNGASAELKARVLQIYGTAGMALGFDDAQAARRQLAPWFEAAACTPTTSRATRVVWGSTPPPGPSVPPARAEPPAVPIPPTTAVLPGASEPPDEEPEPALPAEEIVPDEKQAGPLIDQIRAMNTQQRMHLAAHGDRTARLILLKDPNKTIQTFVLQNPHVTIEEVRYLAGFRQASPDALQLIAGHREWSQNAGVVTALVRNPKTPLSSAVRLLDRLSETELRRLARSNDVPRGVQLAARKKVNE